MLRQRQGSANGLPSHGGGGGSGGFGVDYGNGGGYDAYSRQASPSGFSKKKRGLTGSTFGKFSTMWMLLAFASFGLFCTTAYYRGQVKSVNLQMKDVFKQLTVKAGGRDTVVDTDSALTALDKVFTDRDKFRTESNSASRVQRELTAQVTNLENVVTKVRTEKESLEQKLNGPEYNKGQGTAATAQMVKHVAREQAWKSHAEYLQNATIASSLRAVVDRFGHGPHRVKIALRFAETPKTLEYFIVETAPLALVPHAVHQFLEQVYHECWDNTWFYLNGQHVLQAGPQAYENEEEDEAALHKFQDWGFEKLAFPEYSKEFPHMEWTLGFTGRPGGPDFYINKHDNSMTHGPGGQQQHALSEHADPCFAKVIDGFDVVKKMYNLKVYSDSSSYTDFFEEPVEIVWAKIESSMPSAEETALEHANQKISNNNNSGEGGSHKPGKPKINDRTDMHSEDYADLEDYYEEMH